MRLVNKYLADMLNGEGLRNVYFFTSCTHGCPGCFNSGLTDPAYSPSTLWTEKEYRNLVAETRKSYISGITLTGGDPLSPWNEGDILELVRRFKEDLPEKTIWVYTGYTWETLMKLPEDNPKKQVLRHIDVLCDGPFIEKLRSPKKPWVGSENQRVIRVQESLNQDKIILI